MSKALSVVIIILILGAATTALAGEPAGQRLCPMTGADLATVPAPVQVELRGFTFRVQDEASRDRAIASDPEAVFAALAQNGDAAEPVSNACPVMGNRINRALFVEQNGRRVFICCRGCGKRVQNNWPAILDKLERQAEMGDPESLPEM